ncbi:DUF1697 domain-containing protein [Guptibacillus hwajinpoensis]|uniref:DUF1697 domain-containing protein n=1 Tax=Guptibacillus hwajinpoensis TaxID=208199 RepID=UPI001CFCF98A|nr:DUF1697 domain-containing protein [Pseudalkalibacillus hwajinpoensis]WLR61654.1 DUF1697 domain-containing protein [Pseudalkalibacillus hwajinpoensis]
MTSYIGLLRGIKVGGKNRIKMAELRDALTKEGFLHVKTYIQSGNVFFDSEESEEGSRRRMEQIISTEFGLKVPVLIRSATEWQSMIESCPFHEEQIAKAQEKAVGESLYVAMLAEPLRADAKEKFVSYASDKEEYELIGREVFLLFHDSIRNSKLATYLTRVNEYATIRNWKTINKIADMLPRDVT